MATIEESPPSAAKKPKAAVRNYCYGVKPIEGVGRVLPQMIEAEHYRDRLTVLEQTRRIAVESVLRLLCPDYVAVVAAFQTAKQAVQDWKDRLSARRAAARAKLPATAAEKAELVGLKAAKKELAIQLKELKATTYDRPEVQYRLQMIDVANRQGKLDLRAATTAYWGTYLLVEEAAKNFHKGRPPRRRSWEGEGRIGVQIQNGLSVEELEGGEDRRLRLLPMPGPHRRNDRLLAIRVESDTNRDPVWAYFRINFHREFPDGTRIKRCVIQRRVVGTTVRWRAMFSIDIPAPVRERPQPLVAIHAGWRMFGDRMRIATWKGCDGRTGELFLEAADIAALYHLDDLESKRSCWRDTVSRRIRQWCRAARERGIVLPDWLEHTLEHLHNWKSPHKFRRLAERWAASGFEGDDRIVRYLLWWRRRKDRHLHNWIAHRRRRLVGRRNQLYRSLLVSLNNQTGVDAGLAARYQAAAVLCCDWAKLLKRLEAHVEDDVPTVVRRYGRFAAPATLHEYVEERFAKDTVWLDPHYATQTCHHCQHVNEFDIVRAVVHTCTGCGRTFDIDHNACHNQLRLGAEALVARQQAPVVEEDDGDGFSVRQRRFREAKQRQRELREQQGDDDTEE